MGEGPLGGGSMSMHSVSSAFSWTRNIGAVMLLTLCPGNSGVRAAGLIWLQSLWIVT